MIGSIRLKFLLVLLNLVACCTTANFESRYLVEGPWKLIVPNRPAGTVELYHLEADPHETTNLAAAQVALVARLTEKLDAWWSTPVHE